MFVLLEQMICICGMKDCAIKIRLMLKKMLKKYDIIAKDELCERCYHGNQCRNSFDVRKRPNGKIFIQKRNILQKYLKHSNMLESNPVKVSIEKKVLVP